MDTSSGKISTKLLDSDRVEDRTGMQRDFREGSWLESVVDSVVIVVVVMAAFATMIFWYETVLRGLDRFWEFW